jgi:CRISPR type II-A-associated protein Csn2
MKLVSNDIAYCIDSEETTVTIVVLEDPKTMREWIIDMMRQVEGVAEGRFSLYENEKELNISKNLDLIINPLRLELNAKKIILRLYDALKDEIVSPENYEATRNIERDIQNYILQIISCVEYPVTYDLGINWTAILKALNVRIDEDTSPLESLERYMRLAHEILNIKCFVIVNLKSYFVKEELIKLYKSSEYYKYSILLIESRQSEKISPYEKLFILDADHAEIW